MTPEQLQAAIGCRPDIAAQWAKSLDNAMNLNAIDVPRRQAAFLATIGVESTRLTRGRENLHYTTPERLTKVFGHRINPNEIGHFLRNAEALGNRVYANREGNGNEASGDGYRYRGGGPIGLTFRNNYRAFSEASGFDVLNHPELIESPAAGAAAAAWFWRVNRCNEAIDEGDFRGCQAIVNTGNRGTPANRINGYDERLALWKAVKHVLGVE